MDKPEVARPGVRFPHSALSGRWGAPEKGRRGVHRGSSAVGQQTHVGLLARGVVMSQSGNTRAKLAEYHRNAALEAERAGFTGAAEYHREMLDPRWGLVPRPPREVTPRRIAPVRKEARRG